MLLSLEISAQCFSSQALLIESRPYSSPARAGLSPSYPHLDNQESFLPCVCQHTPDVPPSAALTIVMIWQGLPHGEHHRQHQCRVAHLLMICKIKVLPLVLQGVKHCSPAAAGKSHISYRHLTLIRLLPYLLSYKGVFSPLFKHTTRLLCRAFPKQFKNNHNKNSRFCFPPPLKRIWPNLI